MGLQRYRADKEGKPQLDGAVPYYTVWAGGPTLAKIQNCRIENINLSPRTVYIVGEPDTYFSIPAACEATIDGVRKVIKGFVTTDSEGYYFCAYKYQK